MSIEDIIRAWKADEEALEPSPVGREITQQELLEVTGGVCGLTNEPLCGNDMCTSVYCADVRITPV
ncbi:MAG TPA: hypothetical protein VKU38_07140 [Ktedonobacteraceae bacterium]|nr:hypothetical protein [Ktedonobacteraceae bacterium]